MKRTLFLLSVLLFLGIIAVTWFASQTFAQPPVNTPATGGLPACTNALNVCNSDLNSCVQDLAECEAQPDLVFPGDGYPNPDSYGVSGHGPALSYTDNNDGTFTDDNTGLMWEKKDDLGGIHDKDNIYKWTVNGGGTGPGGTLFNGPGATGTLGTDFLYTLNNSCQNDETVDCHTNGDTDCGEVGGACGFAGHRDWRIPNIKELHDLVNFTVENPAWSAYGDVGTATFTWSATTYTTNTSFAWFIYFYDGATDVGNKVDSYHGRAVRP